MCVERLLGIIHPFSALVPTTVAANELDVRQHAGKLPAHVDQHVQRLLAQEVLARKHAPSLPAILYATSSTQVTKVMLIGVTHMLITSAEQCMLM